MSCQPTKPVDVCYRCRATKASKCKCRRGFSPRRSAPDPPLASEAAVIWAEKVVRAGLLATVVAPILSSQEQLRLLQNQARTEAERKDTSTLACLLAGAGLAHSVSNEIVVVDKWLASIFPPPSLPVAALTLEWVMMAGDRDVTAVSLTAKRFEQALAPWTHMFQLRASFDGVCENFSDFPEDSNVDPGEDEEGEKQDFINWVVSRAPSLAASEVRLALELDDPIEAFMAWDEVAPLVDVLTPQGPQGPERREMVRCGWCNNNVRIKGGLAPRWFGCACCRAIVARRVRLMARV